MVTILDITYILSTWNFFGSSSYDLLTMSWLKPVYSTFLPQLGLMRAETFTFSFFSIAFRTICIYESHIGK